MVDSSIRAHNFCFLNRGGSRHLYYTFQQRFCGRLCVSFAKSEKAKTTPTTVMNIFLSEKKIRKNIKRRKNIKKRKRHSFSFVAVNLLRLGKEVD